jgi:putative FmdB family regulatory protein
MPIYEYRCENGHVLEVMQRISEDPLTSCSTCGAPVERVFHPVAVHFKGSGFYSTDYGKGGSSKAKENGSSGDTKASESGSSDSKPADTKSEGSGSGDSGSKSSAATSSASD